ncbi:MAG TPA: TonB-dependent receptor [Sphingomonas sp.]
MKSLWLASCAWICLPGLAAAQDKADPTPGAGAASNGPESQPAPQENGLNDIVVTAQRRSENLQRAAIAVSAIGGDALRDANITKPTELTTVVPALQVATSAGPYSLFYLRGVGNFNGNALSDSAVAFNFDGVYVGRPSSTTGFFYDLDRVEVVKGPQGTLYGRNATGGAINVIARKPELDKIGAEATAEYGNYNALRLDGAINLPLGDIAAIRAAGIYVKHDGYMKDGTDRQDDLGGRLSLRVEPSTNLSINVVGDYFRQRGTGPGGTPVEIGIDGRPGYFSPQGSGFISSLPNTLLGRTQSAPTIMPFLNNEYWGVSSTIEWRVPFGTITFIPAYREGSLDYLTNTPGFYLRQREKDKQTSFEARVASNENRPVRFLAGLFYYDERNDVPYFSVNQQSNYNLDSYVQKDRSMAAFGRITWAPKPALRFTLGGRYTTEDKMLDGTLLGFIRTCVVPSTYFPTYVPGCPTASSFPPSASLSAPPPVPDFNPAPDGTLTIPSFVDNSGINAKRASFERVTWRAGADWDVTSHNLLYASYETGFKSGGFYFTADAGVFRPETISAWTLGSKNRFFDNRLQLNLEAFYWRYSNQQISHLVNDSAGNAIFATENVGRATFKGVEAETRFLLTPTTELSADVQYLDARYDSFVCQTPNLNGGLGNGTSCPNLGAPGTSYTVDCSGKRPPNAPEWTINLGAQQTINLAGGAKIVGGARAHYQSETLTGLEFLPIEYQGAYWQLDAQVNFVARDSRFTIGAFVNNALNKTVMGNSFPVPFTFYTSASLRPPRTYGVRAGFKF